MADTMHRDVWRVWYRLQDGDTAYSIHVYAEEREQAERTAIREILKSGAGPFIIVSAEKR